MCQEDEFTLNEHMMWTGDSEPSYFASPIYLTGDALADFDMSVEECEETQSIASYVGAQSLVRYDRKWQYPSGVLYGHVELFCRMRAFQDSEKNLICVVTDIDEKLEPTVWHCVNEVHTKLQTEFPGCVHVEHEPQGAGFRGAFRVRPLSLYGGLGSQILKPYVLHDTSATVRRMGHLASNLHHIIQSSVRSCFDSRLDPACRLHDMMLGEGGYTVENIPMPEFKFEIIDVLLDDELVSQLAKLTGYLGRDLYEELSTLSSIYP
jgi:hypothetical protein